MFSFVNCSEEISSWCVWYMSRNQQLIYKWEYRNPLQRCVIAIKLWEKTTKKVCKSLINIILNGMKPLQRIVNFGCREDEREKAIVE